MTYGGIGPRLALLSLPYIILSILIMVNYPEFLDLKFPAFNYITITGFVWGGLGICFWIYSAIPY